MAAATSIDATAQSLVRRARAGDQNAMALIFQVGKAARAGLNARAIAAAKALKRYIDANPVIAPRGGGNLGTAPQREGDRVLRVTQRARDVLEGGSRHLGRKPTHFRLLRYGQVR